MDFFAKSIVYIIYQNILTIKLLYKEVPNKNKVILLNVTVNCMEN